MENSMEEDLWEDNIRRDSLLLNIRGWRRIGISGGEPLKRPGPDVGCRANEEEKKKKSKYRNCVSMNQRNLNPCKSRTYCSDIQCPATYSIQ
jgi:hypothetical protein